MSIITHMVKTFNEESLINLVKHGDHSSFASLVDMYKQQVYNTCYAFVRNREDAEDLAQEVFVEVFRRIGSFKGDSLFSTWLYRIAVNRSLDLLKHQKRQKRSSKLERRLEDTAFYEISSPRANSADEQVLKSERQAVLNSALQKLPEKQRVAFTLSKVDGFSQEEVAGIMKKSVSSVESLLVRSKKKLQELLYKYYKENFF